MGTPKEVVFLSCNPSHVQYLDVFFRNTFPDFNLLSCSSPWEWETYHVGKAVHLVLWEPQEADREDPVWGHALAVLANSLGGHRNPVVILGKPSWKNFLSTQGQGANSFVLTKDMVNLPLSVWKTLMGYWLGWNVLPTGGGQ